MIDLPLGPGHDPRPLTPTSIVRAVVAAATAVAIQASVLDPITSPVLRHLDLPLATAAALVLARPAHSVTIGLVFGLMVDASSQRLFGLHGIAYAMLGPLAHNLPTPTWRRPGLLVAWRAGAQGLVATSIVAVGQTIAAGTLVPGTIGAVLQTGVLVGLVAVPLSRLVGVGAPFGQRRPGPRATVGHGRARSRPRSVPGPRFGSIRPLGP